MHIKQIVIKGFKTYKEQLIIGPLSPKDNVFVGLNGHGKSNFFSAIMFVLSDKFSSIRQEEKQRLIHEGASASSEEASVEIILDNSDGKLPLEKSTVSIKRQLKAAKDEYFLDGKHVSKGDITNLLESGGFSRCNPYYIVQQGRVASLAAMNEAQTLELLKEVAGTKVFEEKKIETDRILEESTRQRAKVQELLGIIEGRISQLAQETEELTKYMELEKRKRALEYILYKTHVFTAQEEIEQLEYSQAQLIEQLNALKIEQDTVAEELENKHNEIDSLQILHDQFVAAWKDAELELNGLHHQRAVVMRQVDSQTDSRSDVHSDKESILKELEGLQHSWALERNKVAELAPEVQSLEHKEAQLQAQIAEKSKCKEQLVGKQGSMISFKSLKERNNFLDREIAALQLLQSELTERHAQFTLESSQLQFRFSELSSQQTHCSTQTEELNRKLYSLQDALSTVKQQRLQNIEALNKLRYEEDAVKTSLDQTNSQLTSTAAKLQFVLPGSLHRTLVQLKDSCRELPGFYGTLLDLIQIPAALMTCAEATGKLKVFSLVVDCFETAKKVLQVNSELGGDSINIYPLDWFSAQRRPRSFPTGSDSIIIMDRIQPRDNAPAGVAALIQTVFGKALLVRSAELAYKYSCEYKLHCVTPDGQIVYAGGYMVRAGFHDNKKERIRAYGNYTERHQNSMKLHLELSRVKLQKDILVSADTEHLRQIQRLAMQKERIHNELTVIRATEQQFAKEQNELTVSIEETNKSLGVLSAEMQSLSDSVHSAQAEKACKDIGALTVKEQRQLNSLIEDLGVLEKHSIALSKEKTRAAAMIAESHTRTQKLLPERQRTLRQQLSDYNLLLDSEDLGELQVDLQHLEALSHSTDIALTTLSQQIKDTNDSLLSTRQQQKTLNAQFEGFSGQTQELQVASEKLHTKYSHLLSIKEEYTKKMGCLGSLPAEEHEAHKSLPTPQLISLIEETAKVLEKHMHVNKRAGELYTSACEKLSSYTTRLSEIDSSRESITELLTHLSSVRDEAVTRTFRSVAQHFSEVFHELVPFGKGKLKMSRDNSQYVGVSICVAFSKDEDSLCKMQQLSGGQKTAVAIALVLAIQRTEPAPFYLFDELDAALDSGLRANLANVIRRSTDKAQFIMTTFRPELCKRAGKLFEVAFTNQSSSIRPVDYAKAQELLQTAGN